MAPPPTATATDSPPLIPIDHAAPRPSLLSGSSSAARSHSVSRSNSGAGPGKVGRRDSATPIGSGLQSPLEGISAPSTPNPERAYYDFRAERETQNVRLFVDVRGTERNGWGWQRGHRSCSQVRSGAAVMRPICLVYELESPPEGIP